MMQVAVVTGQSVAKSLQIGAGIMCRTFGQLTWPKEYDHGMLATRSQVSKPYATVGRVYKDLKLVSPKGTAERFYRLFKTGKRAKALKIVRDSALPYKAIPFGSFQKSFHEQSRNRRGRVKLKAPVYMLNDAGSKALEKYKVRKVKNVGLTQSGWYKCLRLLKQKNVVTKSRFATAYPQIAEGETMKPFPSWVVNGHKKVKNGEVTFNLTGPKIWIKIHNKTPWAKEALHEGAEAFVQNAGRNRIINYLKSTLHYALNPRNRKK